MSNLGNKIVKQVFVVFFSLWGFYSKYLIMVLFLFLASLSGYLILN